MWNFFRKSTRNKVITITVFTLTILTLVGVYLYHDKFWPFKKQEEEITAENANFIINDGIAQGKAIRALKFIENMNDDEKKTFEKNKQNAPNTEIVLKEEENFCLIKLFSELLKNQGPFSDAFVNMKTDKEKKNLLFFIKELASHIKIQSNGGNVSMRKYIDQYYALELFADKKQEILSQNDLFVRSLKEIHLITIYLVGKGSSKAQFKLQDIEFLNTLFNELEIQLKAGLNGAIQEIIGLLMNNKCNGEQNVVVNSNVQIDTNTNESLYDKDGCFNVDIFRLNNKQIKKIFDNEVDQILSGFVREETINIVRNLYNDTILNAFKKAIQGREVDAQEMAKKFKERQEMFNKFYKLELQKLEQANQ